MVPCLGASALADAGLVVHLSAGSTLGQRPGAKVLISSVSRAVSSGADAVSVSVHFGNAQEDRMLADVGRVVDEATSFGLPVLAMAYAPAPPGDPSRDLVVAAHAVRAAAEVGAAIVQTNYLGSLDGVREIARGCPVPLVVAGGPRASPSESLPAFVRGAIRAGAAGVSVGRTIFQSVDPPGTARRIADAIFEPNARILAEVAP
jgi:DhnA family fructose-bisphosphate aldolase class Ia